MDFLLVLLGLVLLACGAYVERRAHERRRGRSMSMDTEMTCAEEEELPVTPPKRYRPPGWAKEAVPTNGAPGPSLLSAVGSIVLLASGFVVLASGLLQKGPPPPPTPVPLIIDTDMSFDVDDVGAICIAHAMMDNGEADLLAVVHSSGYPEGIGAASVLNEWYGHHSVRLGSYKGRYGANVYGRWITGLYVPNLVSRFPSAIKNSSQVPDAVSAYRAALASSADGSVAIAVIGFPTNIAPLLRSGPDQHSALDGVALVAQKVKLVVWQGGWYEPLHPDGHTTFNWDCGGCCGYVTQGCLGEAEYAVAHMPDNVEQIFTDIGDEIYHGGGRLRSCAPPENPCRQAYIDHTWGLDDATAVSDRMVEKYGAPAGRQSWDPLAVLVAVRGVGAANCFKDQQGGRNRADYRGANYWTAPNESAHDSKQSILALSGEFPWFDGRLGASEALDELLCQAPRTRRK